MGQGFEWRSNRQHLHDSISTIMYENEDARKWGSLFSTFYCCISNLNLPSLTPYTPGKYSRCHICSKAYSRFIPFLLYAPNIHSFQSESLKSSNLVRFRTVYEHDAMILPKIIPRTWRDALLWIDYLAGRYRCVGGAYMDMAR